MVKTRKKSKPHQKEKGTGKQKGKGKLLKKKSSQLQMQVKLMMQNVCIVKTFIHEATKAGLLALNVVNGLTTRVLDFQRQTKLQTSPMNCVMMIDLMITP